MASDPYCAGFPVHLDSKRRPTLPARLLSDAGISESANLVARVDGPGRIVLEDPALMLKALQKRLATAPDVARESPSAAVDALAADRSTDSGLR